MHWARKWIISLFVTALVVSLFAGCSGSSETSESTQEESSVTSAEVEQAEAEKKAAEEAAAAAQAELEAVQAAEAEAKAAAEIAVAEKAEAEKLLAEAKSEEEKAAAEQLLAEKVATEQAAIEAATKALAEKEAAQKLAASKAAAQKVATNKATTTKAAAKPTRKNILYTYLRNQNIVEYPENGGPAKQKILTAAAKAGITNFDYKVIMAGGTGSEYITKLNLLASSDDLPDVFDIDEVTIRAFAEQGLILPLNDLLKKSASIQKYTPKSHYDAVTFNGKIYGIPNGILEGDFNSPNVTGFFVRQDWMQQLGLKNPETLEEFESVLRAFKNGDPDNNGKKDTIPLSAFKDTRFEHIFGAFGIAPTHWQVRDGRIQKGFILPETKEALAVLQRWYKEGLIDPEFPVIQAKQETAKFTNSQAAISLQRAFVMNDFNPVYVALTKGNPNAKMALIAPPKGPKGFRGYAEESAISGNGGFKVFSSKIKEPERLMEFINWIATPVAQGGGNELVVYGEEGLDYTIDSNDFITSITATNDLYKKGYSNPIRFFFAIDRRNTQPAFRETLKITSKYTLNNELWKSLPSERDYPDLELKLWPEYFIKIVTGEWSVEKWHEFVVQYYKQGGRKIENEANAEWKLKGN